MASDQTQTGEKAPGGLLGIAWGEDAQAAAGKLGLECGRWTPWEGGSEYEACFDTDHPVEAFGSQAMIRLFRKEGRLQGMSLRYRQGGMKRSALTDAVGKEFQMTTTEGNPYKVFDDGSVVRLDYDRGDDTCELTVTGPDFGKVFAGYVLGVGLRGMAAGLRP